MEERNDVGKPHRTSEYLLTVLHGHDTLCFDERRVQLSHAHVQLLKINRVRVVLGVCTVVLDFNPILGTVRHQAQEEQQCINIAAKELQWLLDTRDAFLNDTQQSLNML